MCELLERYGRESRMTQLFELVEDAVITVFVASQKADMSEEKFVEQMKLSGYRIPEVV